MYSAGEVEAFMRLRKLTSQMDDGINKLVKLSNNIRTNSSQSGDDCQMGVQIIDDFQS